MTYTGKALKPAVTVKDGKQTLEAGTDYTTVYGSNTKVGTAKVTVTGKGNYTGSVTLSFKIIEPTELKAKSGTYSLKNGEATLKKSPGVQTVTIPASVKVGKLSYKVTAIGAKAFRNDKVLTTLTIGKYVKAIGKNAFAGCTKLKTVKGGAAVTTVSASAFSGDTNLTAFPFLKKLVTVGTSAFQNCKALKSFTLGTKVKSIGKKAFYQCKALETITVKTTLLSSSNVKAAAFKGTPANAIFNIPKSKGTAYRKLLISKGAKKTCTFRSGKTVFNDGTSEMADALTWMQEGADWFCLDGEGNKLTGWQKVDGRWYYLDENGTMRTGWLQSGESWYYLQEDGSMATGWLEIDSQWYYFLEDGRMAAEPQLIDNQWEIFDERGIWQGTGVA